MYMNLKTFELISGKSEDLPDVYRDDCVEIDDLIAPSIQVLNQKGYHTRFCCQGHHSVIGGGLEMKFSESDTVADGSSVDEISKFIAEQLVVSNSPLTIITVNNSDEENGWYAHVEMPLKYNDSEAYIAFYEPFPRELIPECWNKEEHYFDGEDDIIRIVHDVSENANPMEYLEEVWNDMRKLYEWVCELPDRRTYMQTHKDVKDV